MLEFVRIAIGEGGVCRCCRCAPGTAHRFKRSDDVVAEVRQAVTRFEPAAGPNVLLSGAEAFKHPDLPAIVRESAVSGVSRIGVETDAHALSDGDNATGSLQAGIRYIEVPLLGGDAQTHDSRAGSAGSFDRTFQGIAAFRSAAERSNERVAVAGRIEVCKHTRRELPQIVAALLSAGARLVRIVLPTPLEERTRPWLEAALDTAMVGRAWAWVEGVDPEHLGARRLHAVPAVRLTEGGVRVD